MRYNHTPTTQTQPWAADWRARAIAIYQATLDRLQARLQVALQRGMPMYRRLPLITNTSRAAERSVASVPNLMAGDWKARGRDLSAGPEPGDCHAAGRVGLSCTFPDRPHDRPGVDPCRP
jgi:hypothetical protein